MNRYVMVGLLLVLLCGVTAWMTSIGEVGIFKMFPPAKVASAALRHMQIVAAAEALAIVFGILIGFLATRRAFRFISPVMLGIANMGQTVPTLAFIGIASVLLGMGYKAAVVALFVYAILPIIRNTYAGIRSVDPAVKEAAQ